MKCSKCGKKIIIPKIICGECINLELRINSPRYFGKAIINGQIHYSNDKGIVVDRWKTSEEDFK